MNDISGGPDWLYRQVQCGGNKGSRNRAASAGFPENAGMLLRQETSQ
jgi:hypothetical protein